MDNLIVVHTADLHLGKNRKFDDYLEQQSYMLTAMVDQVAGVLKDNPSSEVFFVVAGDIFDRNQDTRRVEFVLFLTHFVAPVQKLLDAYPQLTVFMIDGNHDRQPDPVQPSVLSPLLGLLDPRIRLSVVKPTFYEDKSFLAVPYGGYSAKELTALFKQYKPTFVAAHECLSRMQTDTGWSPPRDQDHYIEINDVMSEASFVQGVFLGDIHRCQYLDDNELVWYSGTPITLDHGHRPPKGLLHHPYEKKNGIWSKIKEHTQLKPLSDPRLKTHVKVGQVTKTEDIPWDTIKREGVYVDLVLSPEVHRAIIEEVPDFFSKPEVSWSFERKITAEITEESSFHEEKLDDKYYSKAIQEWAELNLTHLSEVLKDEFTRRAETLFVGRC